MKDIDFDELDRAVTSALNASGVSPDQSSQQDTTQSSGSDESSPETTQSISSHTVHARIMSSSTPGRTTLARKPVVAARATTSIAEAIEVTKAPAPVSSPVKRSIPHREGRFMDVVHPGAKSTLPTPTITLAPKPTEMPLPVEAEELSLTPGVAEEPVAEKPHNASLEAAINNLFISEGHSPVASDTTEESDKASPIEELNATTVPSDVEPTSVSTDDTATDEIAAELGMPLEDARSNSPFISDAKVEKRPLGEIEQIDSLETSLEPVVEDVAELLPEMNEASNAPVPEELTSDIAAIESHEAGVENIAEPQVVEETPVETSAPELSSSGPTSIARQYKEQPRTASEDDESGAIFDPQTYQSPVEHPAKKSSGWGWVIACVLIIILATIAGVVAWMEGMLPVPL